jgi:radical SAM-linked protein
MDRQKKLERALPASVKGHFVEGSILEGVLARGDRKLSKVILKAWEKGCRFDQWKEHSRYDLWQQSFREAGIDADFYIRRERGSDEVFPWDHLQFAAEKKILRKEYEKAFEPYEQGVAPVQPVKDVLTGLTEGALRKAGVVADGVKPMVPLRERDVAPVQRLRIRLGRRGVARFLSHLEQIDVFRRAARRAGLPVAFSSGFSPQVKAAFGPAISVGYESACEYFELDLIKWVEPAEAAQKLKNALPEGFDVLDVKKTPLFFPSLDSLLNIARYNIAAQASKEEIKHFLSAPKIIVEKIKEKQVVKIDAKPLIKELHCDDGVLYIELRFGPKKNVKPEKVAQLLLDLNEEETKTLRIQRVGFLIEKKDGTVMEP